ncbi:MAG TPA: AAA family ATPase, partial [Solirubrobacterales bacterium]|nr:AAA family ATPase [Solirubrobacterales bacterium]
MSTVLKRVEVTGGFLHDLDIDLSPGLNVIVGPRGAGKTSVLELLRYVFGVPGITEEGERRAHRHALDVLEDGSVNVTVAQDGEEASASRDASADEGPPVQPLGLQPLIVSQREIEDIGLNARSRLHILDGLVGTAEEHVEPDLLQQVQLAAAEIDRLLEVVDRQRTRLLELSDIPGRLATAEQEAEARGAASSQIETAQAQLRALSERLGAVSKGAGDTQQKLDSIDAVREAIADASEYASKLAGFQAEDPISAHVRKGKRMLEDAFDEIEAARKLLEQRDGEEGEKVTEIRRELREQGERLESLQSGAGDLAKRLTRLREQEVEHRQVSERIEGLEREIGEAQVNRDRLLDELDAFRQRRYERRKKGVELVARLFDGEIKVRLTKWGMFRDYEVALAKALTGSGLQYKALAHQIACRLDPRKLVEAVEDNDAWKVSELGEITLERAERLVSHLRSRGSASLLVAPLEDAVDYALLDGEEYKSTSELSTGQRCTVILPLLLAQSAQLTILDQPEDHLDNAFVVDTLVRALLARKNTGQLIIATHNANIPVLGNADKVIVMGSDGRHGGVQQIGGLDDPAVVRSVSSIMEGGEEAFRLRAEFYAGPGNEVKVAPERWSPPATERPDAGDPEPPAEERPPAEEAPDERAEAPAANSIAPEEDAAMAPEPAEPAPSLDDSVPEQDAAPASDPEPIEQDAPPVAEDAPLARESAPMADV